MAGRGIAVVAAALLLAVSACSGDDETAEPTTTTGAATATSTTAAAPSDGTSTTAPGGVTPGASTTSTLETTSTAASSPSDTTTTTTGAPSTTSSTTTTSAPAPPVEAQPATPGCPNDLFLTTDEYGERADNVLAAYLPPAQDPLWEIPLGYESVVDFAAADGRVFALLTSGTLIAIDVADCGEAWRVDLGRAPGAVTGGLDVEDGTLVVTASSRVSAYEAADGTNLWSDSLATPARRPLLREGIAVIAGDTTPWLRSYDVPEGGLYFDESAGFSGPIESMDADFDAVYLAGGGKVEGRWIDDGTSLFSVSSSLTSGVTLFDVYAYVIGEDSVAALDFDTGEEIWSTELADRALPALGIAADGVLVFTQDGQANRLDFDAGFATPGGDYGAFRVFPEFDDDLFLVTSDDGTVTAYNLFEEAMFTLPTGANGLDRFTHLEFVDDTVVTNTFSAERF